MQLAVIDSYDMYIKEISRFPVLSEKSELEYALDYYHNKSLESAKVLIQSCLRYVVRIAHQYKNYHLPITNLIQEGNIGLMQAIKKFDPYKNRRLVQYALYWIRAYIHTYVMNNCSLVKIGTKKYSKDLFFNPTEKSHKFLQSQIDEMNIRKSGDSSLDIPYNDKSEETFANILANEDYDVETDYIEKEEEYILKDKIKEAMCKLSDRERDIVYNRIMIDSPIKLQELADKYNVSKERIRQLESIAINKIKKGLQNV